MKRTLFLSAALVAVVGCSTEQTTVSQPADTQPTETGALGGGGPFAALSMMSYEVTIENLTAEGAQVFSPPVLATHTRAASVFSVGETSSDALAALAEDGVTQDLVGVLEDTRGVREVVAADGPIPPGQSASWIIRGSLAQRQLSAAFMLVNTNDAFSGLESITLPMEGESVYMAMAYDAGSEVNTELISDIPGPCCGNPFMGEDEDGVIEMHAGILGIGDLDPDVYGWKGPVARITVRRIPATYDVTVENLTPETVAGGSQVFSPPVLATHNTKVSMFRVGELASDELAALAEDGMTGPLLGLLDGNAAVRDTEVGGGPIPPGAMASYTITGGRGDRLSMAFMLVNTNDAFSGLDTALLPTTGTRTYMVGTYDAGSEENTELAEHIPGPCCGSPGAGNPTEENIDSHPGILGVGDLDPKDYGWTDPAARITVTRVY